MDDKYGVKVENRYALFLDEEENENDENQLLEQVALKGGKKAAATPAGKTTSVSPQKGGAKIPASTPIASDVRGKSAGSGSTVAGAKKSPASTTGGTATAAAAAAAGKDGGQRTKFGAPRVENEQQIGAAGAQKFVGGRPPREANDQSNGERPPRDGQYNRGPRGGGYGGAPRVNYGERSGGNNEGDSSQSAGERPNRGYGGERRGGGGYRGGYRGGEGEQQRGGYRGGDRQDRPPRQPRFEGGAEGGEHAQPESGGGVTGGQEQDQQGEGYGQRDVEGRSGGQGGYNSEYSGRNRGYGGGPREYRGGSRGGYRGGIRNDYAGEQSGEHYGRRQFDRHSGNEQTGIKPVEKKGGAGGHNWGKVVDTDAALEPISADQYGDENGEGNQGEGERSQGRKPRSKEDEERAEQRAEERRKLDAERAEDEKKMTLAQYKEQQKEIKEKDAPKFNLRKPGEGEDQSWLKKVTVVNESKKAHVEQQEEEGRKDRHAQEHNLAQDLLGIRYEPSNRVEQRGGFRGDRGDRRGGYRGDGGGRGGYSRDGENQDVRRGGYGGEHHGESSGGYGGGRGYHGAGRGRNFAPAPSISDPKDFPALGLGAKPAAAAPAASTGKA